MIKSLYDHNLKIGDLEPRLPIIQGGMAVRISLAPLAAAVANEGGAGVIGASGMHPMELRKEIRRARQLTDGIIGVNVMVAVREFQDLVQVTIEEKADLLIIGAGFPGRKFLADIKEEIAVFLIVSNPKAVIIPIKLGLAGVVLESGMAGGHLGTKPNVSIWELLPPAVAVLKKYKNEIDPNFSLVAAGGILYGGNIARVLAIGADGVQMGTRFAVSEESSAHNNWKKIILDAEKEDIVVINSPVGMPLRTVRTPFVEKIEAGDIPKLSEEFQEEHCRGCLSECGRDYCIFQRLVQAQKGNVKEGLFTIGARGWEIKKILSVEEIISNLISEFEHCVV